MVITIPLLRWRYKFRQRMVLTMKLKDLIRLHLTGELGALQHTTESLLEIELTLCSQQTLDGLSDLFYRVSEACED